MSQLCNFWRQGDLENPATIALLLSLKEIPIINFYSGSTFKKVLNI